MSSCSQIFSNEALLKGSALGFDRSNPLDAGRRLIQWIRGEQRQ
jgi:hypothetical protein